MLRMDARALKRIDELLAAMTLEEKIGQLSMAPAGQAITGPGGTQGIAEAVRAGRVGGLLNIWGAEPVRTMQRIAVEDSRLRIPLLIGFDVLHGHRTIFPIPLAEAALFDPQLWELTARAAAVEAAQDGINMAFAPMLDIARDLRWGRIAEGPGEDPWVAALFAEAKVRGFQGASLAAADSIAATAKHFCAYGAALAGRDYASADVSERLLQEVYLPPFEAAIAAGCAAIMPAFNDLNGVPMTANASLLRDWLRRRHGFEGVIISDYDAVAELLAHGVAADLAEAAAAALAAGVDIDMASDAYRQGLPTALARGLATMDQIDASVRRVLILKERLGLFEDPCRRSDAAPLSSQLAAAHRALARESARRAIVVLTNDGVLPISRAARRIALIGPLADASAEMRGPWPAAGETGACVTIRQGLSLALLNCEIIFEKGVDIDGDEASGFGRAIEACRGADLVVMCLGEAAGMSGEAASRAHPSLPGLQNELAQAAMAQGAPTIALISSGRPLIIPAIVEKANAVVAAWFLGAEAGNAIADVLVGAFNPTGRLSVTWPRDIGQVPIYYATRPTGRPPGSNEPYASGYLDMATEPLFPFGHGLSYSRFALTNLRASTEQFKLRDEIRLTADVFNEGPAGEETIFLFARDIVASVARPLLVLKAAARIALRAGESGNVQFALPARSLCFLDQDLRPRLEPGEFHLSVGPSADPRKHLTITIRATAD